MSVCPDTVKLLPEYDVLQLQKDLGNLADHRFRSQSSFKKGNVVEGSVPGWHVLSLRSAGGDPARTDPGGLGLVGFADTPLLEETPYIASVLSALPMPLMSVRLMSLHPGASVPEHKDGCGLSAGWVRLHLPVVTNDGAVIVLGGRQHRWQPGELWYADFGRPHSVSNKGGHARVHLVIDCYVNEGLLELFPAHVLPQIDRPEIMFYREEQPVPLARLEALTGPISVPAKVFQPLEEWDEDPPAELAPDCDCALRIVDGQFVLIVDSQVRSALVHLGDLEFRQLGGTEGTTLKFEFPDGARRIRYRRRFGNVRREIVRG